MAFARVPEKWRKDAKLKIPRASSFATRLGNIYGDSAKLPALANNGLREFRSAVLEARYFRNFVDISRAVGLNSPTVLHHYKDDLVTLSGYERFNCLAKIECIGIV